MKGSAGDRPPDGWLSAVEAARRLGVSDQTIIRRIKKEVIAEEDSWVGVEGMRSRYFVRPEAVEASRRNRDSPGTRPRGVPGSFSSLPTGGVSFVRQDDSGADATRIQMLEDQVVDLSRERDFLATEVFRLRQINDGLVESHQGLSDAIGALTAANGSLASAARASGSQLTAND